MAKEPQKFDIQPAFDIQPDAVQTVEPTSTVQPAVKTSEQRPKFDIQPGFDIKPDPLAFLARPPIQLNQPEFLLPEINRVADPTSLPDDLSRDLDLSDPMGEILSAELIGLGVAGKIIGAPLERINKAVSVNLEPWMRAFTPFEEWAQNTYAHAGAYLASKTTDQKEFIFQEAKALRPDIDWDELKKIPGAFWSGMKALVPWPGMADRVPTFGKIMGDRYTRLTGKEPPFGYQTGMDIAAETVGLGLVSQAAQAAKGGTSFAKSLVNSAKLTPDEIQQAQKIFVKARIAQMTPAQVRVELAKHAAELQKIGQPATTATEKLTSLVRIADKSEKQRKILRSKELGKRVSKAEKIKKLVADPRLSFKKSLSALKGELPKGKFTPPEANLSADDVTSLFWDIKRSSKPFFTQLNTSQALESVLAGEIPGEAGIQLLQRQFGSELVKAIISRRTFGEKAGGIFLDIMNFNRTMLASHDLSFPLRQGGMLLPGHPSNWAKSFGRMIKAAGSERYAKVADDALDFGRFAEVRARSGLERLPIDPTLTIAAFREEEFMSTIANRFPGVKISNRAFVTMGNQLRANIFDSVASRWVKAGITPKGSPAAYQDLAKFLNAATGRGSLGKLENLSGVLNAAFFAPRLQVSRVQLPIQLMTAEPPVRKLIAKDLATWVGSGLTIMQLAKWAGSDVESNPTSSDFGKIIEGNTRFDIWSGNVQLARVLSQVISGRRKAAGTGRTKLLSRQERVDILTRFLRTKLSPPVSFGVDVIKGQSVVGDPIDLKTPAGITKEIWNRTAPLVAQDTIDAIRYQGLDGSTPFVIGGATLGLGVQTWPDSASTKAFNIKQRAAQDYAGVNWDQLSPSETQVLSANDKEIQQALKEATFERTDYHFVGDLAQRQKEHGNDTFQMLDPFIRRRFAENFENMGSLTRTFGTWEMNDEKFKAYKQAIADSINQRHIKDLMKGSKWDARSIENKQAVIQKIKEQAKERAKVTIMKISEAEARRR